MCPNIRGLRDFERLGDILTDAELIHNKIFEDSQLPIQYFTLHPLSVLENITSSLKITQPLDSEWKKSRKSE